MAPPVDPLREHDSYDERRADDQVRGRSAAALLLLLCLLAPAELWPRRCERRLARLLVGRRFASRARLDQARLQLAEEVCVRRQRLGELRLHAALTGHLTRELLQLVRRALDLLIGV